MEFGFLKNEKAEKTSNSRNQKRRRNSEMEIFEESKSVQVHIPQEIIDNILPGLPLKSLVRFQSVCKSWHSIILNSNFQRDRHSILSIPISSQGAVYRSIREHEMPFVEEFPVFWDSSDYQHSRTHVSNSCNGMVLVCVGTSFYLFNPSTHYSVKVLILNYLGKRNGFDTILGGRDIYYKLNIGLYYDKTISDYKAVVLIRREYLQYAQSDRDSIFVEASLKGKRWNHLCHTFRSGDDIKVGPMVNGRFYWLVNQKITRFDPVLKVFEDLPTFQPLASPNHSRHSIDIVGIEFMEGCLCLCRTIEKSTIEMLAMKEFGVSESWTPIFSFSVANRFFNIRDCKPLLLTKTGELFVSIYGYIWEYNLNNKSLKDHRIGTTQSVSFVQNTDMPSGYYWNQTEHENFGNTEDIERMDRFWKK